MQLTLILFSPTVKQVANGTPIVPGLNLRVAAPSDSHGHDHGHSGPRSDMGTLPSWTSKSLFRRHSLLSRMAVNGMCRLEVYANCHSNNVANVTGTGTQVRGFSSSARSLQAPDFSETRVKNPEVHRAFSYFMIGTFGAVSAASARSTVTNFLSTMSASSDVLALAKVEVDMSNIPEGKNAIIKWRGKPVFVRHRTQAEIDEANQVDMSSLRDPEADSDLSLIHI